jgi:hypothetical protein
LLIARRRMRLTREPGFAGWHRDRRMVT